MEVGERKAIKLTPEERARRSIRAAELGEMLKEARLSKNLSTREAGEIFGVSSNYISEMERGIKVGGSVILQEMAQFYGLDEYEVCSKGGRLSPKVEGLILYSPHIQRVVGAMYDKGLTEKQIKDLSERIIKIIDEV